MKPRIAKRVLLIGWDAADWQIIRPLIDRGWMPTLAQMIERGVCGNLATIQPVLSPMLWNSIATGKRADKHGICGFLEPKPDRSGIRPVSSTSRKCKAIWNILSQAGLRSNVVSWFASHPAEPILGSVVTDRFAARITARSPAGDSPRGTFHPDSLASTLEPLLVRPSALDAEALLPFVPRAAEIDQSKDDRLIRLAALLARASTVHAAACRLMVESEWDFMAVYYSAIDEFGHAFMPYHPPRLEGVEESDAEIYQDVMVGCYRFHDMMLEALLAYAGPETTVILVSDHGFESGQQRPSAVATEHPEHWHRAFGIACLSGPGVRQGDQLYGATLLDVTPTILTTLGLPVGNDMDGRPWLEVFDPPLAVERIESWESVPGESGMHAEEAREDPVDAVEVIRRLVALGYVEPPSEDAEESIRQVLRDRRINLAVALGASRRAAQAVPEWQELIAQYPDEVGFRIQLAACLQHLGRHHDCRDALLELDDATRESPYVQLMLAAVALEDRAPDVARSIAREVLNQAGQNHTLLNRIGEILARAESWAEAERVFRRSLRVLSDNPVAHDGIARVLLVRGQFEEAAEHALIAVGLTHFFPPAHFHLGLALQGAGRNTEAIAALETSLGMGYKPRDAHQRLAELYRSRDPEKARHHEMQAQRR